MNSHTMIRRLIQFLKSDLCGDAVFLAAVITALALVFLATVRRDQL